MGVAMLLGFHMDPTEYPDPTSPVTARAVILAHQATNAQLTLALEGAAGWDYPLSLITGTHVYTFSLPVSIRPGTHHLNATLAAAGLSHTASTSFVYGTNGADLTVSPPRILRPSAGLTRTVEVLVYNQGGFPALSTTLQLWDNPTGTGTLLAESPVPPLEAGGMARIPFTWEISGQGGPHTLAAVVDPTDVVGEWREENNQASAEILLPSFALEVQMERSRWFWGEPVSATVRATNLLRSAEVSLVVTATLERTGWIPGRSQTLLLTLEPLEQGIGVCMGYRRPAGRRLYRAGLWHQGGRKAGDDGQPLALSPGGLHRHTAHWNRAAHGHLHEPLLRAGPNYGMAMGFRRRQPHRYRCQSHPCLHHTGNLHRHPDHHCWHLYLGGNPTELHHGSSGPTGPVFPLPPPGGPVGTT